jgi:fermentation-respiration switch protein FrsA (DUF1100 family)
MIFPGSATQGSSEALVIPRPGLELLTLKSAKGERIAAVFGSALTEAGERHPSSAHQPTLLYFYGNGWCLRHAADADLDRFRKLGLNVLIPDYLGYGMSSGDPGESACYETADACLDHLLNRPDIDPARIVVVGRSLGGAVAIDLAARRPVAGLVVFCTFTTLVEMAQKRFPYLPAKLLLRHRFDSIAKIGKVACPILIGHGADDQLVPASMSTLLASAAKTSVSVFTVAGAHHNDFYEVGEAQVLEALRTFIAQLGRRENEHPRPRTLDSSTLPVGGS